MFRLIIWVVFMASCLITSQSVIADEPGSKKKPGVSAKSEFVLADDVKAALVPLFSTIAKADVSRSHRRVIVRNGLRWCRR